jgi:hypothetical protein
LGAPSFTASQAALQSITIGADWVDVDLTREGVEVRVPVLSEGEGEIDCAFALCARAIPLLESLHERIESAV